MAVSRGHLILTSPLLALDVAPHAARCSRKVFALLLAMIGFGVAVLLGLAGTSRRSGLPITMGEDGALEKRLAGLEHRLAELEIEAAEKTSSPFIFIKPHAVTEAVINLVKTKLKMEGILVKAEGNISAEVIDSKQLIDTHYGAIASKAVKQKPAELTVQPKAQEDFKNAFGISWEDALKQDLVFNAMDGAKKLGITPEELGIKYDTLKKGVDMIKFGGGFYCGKVDNIFVINGFYMNMRAAFTAPGKSIYYFVTEFPAGHPSWGDFRCKILGCTDPKNAEPGSVRHTIFTLWKDLDLAAEPNTGDNGVHASASPFEAMAERANWLGTPIAEDRFGRAIVAKGVPQKTIEHWTNDPPVNVDGRKQSFFDSVEDMDGSECLSTIAAIYEQNKE